MSEKTFNEREEALMKVREIYGPEAENAIRDHLKMVGNDFYLWLADLYIPRYCQCDNFDDEGNRICLLPRDENGKCTCHGGGFYFSYSARDNAQFDIDIESTAQVLFFLHSSGLTSAYDYDHKKALPKQMQKDLISFAKSLQDSEDGYFYHPQWGKKITSSRQGRDLGWSTGIITQLGDIPLYDTKNGHKGSLGAPTGVTAAITETEKENNNTWNEDFRTLDAFKAYINSFDLKTTSYSSGNRMNAQCGQIKAREKQGIECGEFTALRPDGHAVGGFVEAFETRFNAAQNPENGLWEDAVYYNSVNGLMKISSVYNALGLKLNYASRAFDSAMEILLLDVDTPDIKGKMATGSVDTFNPWVSMNAIFENVKKFGTPEEYDALQKKFKERVVDLIRASTKKAMKFKKPDGSFGYNWGGVGAVSQMAPVAIKGTIEGDVNGGCIAVNGIFRNISATLGIKIPIFSPEDFEIFINKIKKRCNYK